MNEYATAKELSQLIGVDRHTLRNWYRAKKIPEPTKIGLHQVYHVPTVLEHVKKNRLPVDDVTKSIIDNSN
jgi:predicted site-specific integrase-resolvase